MKRFSAMVVVLGMVAALAGLALAAEKEKTPDATLKLSKGQVTPPARFPCRLDNWFPGSSRL